MVELTSLTPQHIEDAARLVSSRYEQLLIREPHLPAKYAEVGTLRPLLQSILEAPGPGVAAISGTKLVGFLTGWQMPSFRGQRSVYSPEWANAADLNDSRRMYELMYSRIAREWVADRYIAHYISLFPNDVEALQAWHWMGFGMVAVDGIRSLEPIESQNIDARIRRATLRDIEVVMEMHEALWQYHKNAPIFLLGEKKDRSYHEQWLQDSDKAIWLAYWQGEPVAFISLGPADRDVCTVICDDKTTSAYAAFTKETVRRQGIASALLNHALQTAQASGYQRCAISFEPMNVVATRCWLRYFRPVCYSLFRHVDDRVTEALVGPGWPAAGGGLR